MAKALGPGLFQGGRNDEEGARLRARRPPASSCRARGGRYGWFDEEPSSVPVSSGAVQVLLFGFTSGRS